MTGPFSLLPSTGNVAYTACPMIWLALRSIHDFTRFRLAAPETTRAARSVPWDCEMFHSARQPIGLLIQPLFPRGYTRDCPGHHGFTDRLIRSGQI